MSDQDLRLCVALPTHDRRDLTVQVLEAVVPQLEPNDELIVASDGSPAAANEVLRKWLEARHPEGKLLALPRGGVSAARNAALAEAAAPVVCFVDDDVVPDPDWLLALRRSWASASRRVAVIGGPMLPSWGAPRPPWLKDWLLYVVAAFDLGPDRRRLDQTAPGGFVWGGNISIRVEAARAVGGFDPGLGLRAGAPWARGEEEELQVRLASAGWEVWYEPSAIVHHQIPPERLSVRHFREFLRREGEQAARAGASRTRALADLLRGSARYVVLRVARDPEAENAIFGIVRAWAVIATRRDRPRPG